MNRIALVFAILIVGAFSLFAQAPRTVSLTDEMLKLPSAADWPAWRRDRAGSGYSPLDQINRRNVRNLRLAWAGSMESGSLEPEPLVFNGIMYLPHPGGFLQARSGNISTRKQGRAFRGSPGILRSTTTWSSLELPTRI
jgi:glucose dehydrogenase